MQKYVDRTEEERKGWAALRVQTNVYLSNLPYSIPSIPCMQSSCLTHVKLCTYITTTTNMRTHSTHHTHTQIHKYLCMYLFNLEGSSTGQRRLRAVRAASLCHNQCDVHDIFMHIKSKAEKSVDTQANTYTQTHTHKHKCWCECCVLSVAM